jgi:hypothetical protein
MMIKIINWLTDLKLFFFPNFRFLKRKKKTATVIHPNEPQMNLDRAKMITMIDNKENIQPRSISKQNMNEHTPERRMIDTECRKEIGNNVSHVKRSSIPVSKTVHRLWIDLCGLKLTLIFLL